MAGETNLKQLIKTMRPALQEGNYVFSTVSNADHIPRKHILCEFKEQEGITLVMQQALADLYDLKYDYVAAWITLKVHSALAAVGLTAAFSNALAKHGISCNVIAGYYHDHIFVAKGDGEKAVNVLNKLAHNGN